MNITRIELQAIIDAAAQRTAEASGITDGMLSEREANKRFGKWFRTAVKDSRIVPAQIGKGRNGTRRYQLSDILTLQAADKMEARIQLQAAAREVEHSFI